MPGPHLRQDARPSVDKSTLRTSLGCERWRLKSSAGQRAELEVAPQQYRGGEIELAVARCR